MHLICAALYWSHCNTDTKEPSSISDLGLSTMALDKALGALSAQNYTKLLSLFASPCAHSQVLTALQC